MVAGAMIKPEIILLAALSQGQGGEHHTPSGHAQGHDHGLSPGHPAGDQHHSKEVDSDDHGQHEGDECDAEDAGGAIQLGLDACRIISLAKAPVSNEKEIKKSLKGQQDPGSRPHKDHKNGQNPRRYVDKNGAARLPSRPGTTS